MESLNQTATLFPVNTVQADLQQTRAIPCCFPWPASLIPRHTTKPLGRACPELSGQEAASPGSRLSQPTGPVMGPEVCGCRCKPVASRQARHHHPGLLFSAQSTCRLINSDYFGFAYNKYHPQEGVRMCTRVGVRSQGSCLIYENKQEQKLA